MDDDALDGLLAQGLDELGIEADAPARRGLLALTRLLEHWGERINLVGPGGAETILKRRVLGALALRRQLPPATSLVDLGSGAGLPGLPVALLEPGTRVLLVESRLRRHHFQKAACRELGLAQARPLLGRIEELAPEPCQGVVAQAVAPPDQVVAWMRPWARPPAWLAIPGSADAPGPAETPSDVVEAEVRRYREPLDGPERSVWLARIR